MVDVTQEDRGVAAAWCASQPFPSKLAEAPMIAAGKWDHHSLVQAFAHHRQAGVQQGLDMAAAYIQAEYPFDKRKLVPAIRKLGANDGTD